MPSEDISGPMVGLGGHSFEMGGPSCGTFDDTNHIDRDDEHVTTEVGDDSPTTHPKSDTLISGCVFPLML